MVQDSLGRSHLDKDAQNLHEDIHTKGAGRDFHTVVVCTDMRHMGAD